MNSMTPLFVKVIKLVYAQFMEKFIGGYWSIRVFHFLPYIVLK